MLRVTQIFPDGKRQEIHIDDVLAQVHNNSPWLFIQISTQGMYQGDFETVCGYRFTLRYCKSIDDFTYKIVFDVDNLSEQQLKSIKLHISDHYSLAPIKLFGNVVFIKTCKID